MGISDDDARQRKFDGLLSPEALVPVDGTVRVDGADYPVGLVVDALGAVLSDRRKARIEAAIAGRTLDVAPVVEGIANIGNVGAVMRTAEAFGFQRFHVVTDGAAYKDSSRTTQGAHKWLDVSKWETATACADHLKSTGHTIFATTLSPSAKDIEEADFSGPCALVFGNEVDGVSDEMTDAADELIAVRTPGLVESLNISVAAAVCLYHVYRFRRQHSIADIVTDDQRAALRLQYYARSVRDPEALIRNAVREATSSQTATRGRSPG